VCDYCDCRSHPPIASLSADHEVILDLLVDLLRAVAGADAERARPLIAELHALLDRHATREDRGVFTQLRRADVDGGYVARFERDHDEIHRLLAECSGRDWRRPAGDLAQLLGEHIAREESDLFPAAHQLLRPDQWDVVDAMDAQLAEAAT
jgi:hemerythrin-like domain-containing protein